MSDRWLFLVFSNPAEGQEAEYHEWYDSTHLPEVCALDGALGAARYELAVDDPDATHRFLAVYELDRDPEEFMADLGAATQDGRVHMPGLTAPGSDFRFWKLHAEYRP